MNLNTAHIVYGFLQALLEFKNFDIIQELIKAHNDGPFYKSC